MTVPIMQGPPGAETMIDGRRYLYFAGTGYLGLQGHPEVIAAAQVAVAKYGVHSATTRSGFGNSPPVVEVEQRAARLLGCEDACYLISGYAGNFAICAALSEFVDIALVDENAHDCLREATRWLSCLRQPPIPFRHRDTAHLEQLLAAQAPDARPLVLTDGVFAVSGNLAPLDRYVELLEKYPGAMLLVDDAHGLAAVGAQGRGSLEVAGVGPEQINRDLAEPCASPRVFLASTLSKAVGGQGGVVAGSRAFLDRVRAASGWFRAASAPAAPVAAATAKALEIIERDPEMRHQLTANVVQLRRGLGSFGLAIEDSPAPIIGLRLGSAARMQAVQQQLWRDGIAVAYTRDYAGAGPEGIVRIAVFATHTQAMIDRLLDALAGALALTNE